MADGSIIIDTKKIAELVETAQGGNGILTQTGGYLHDYAGKMGEAHAITNKQVEELWALVEADETAGKSNSEMYDSMLESEQRSEIIGTLRRMPQNFLFKGLPDDIKDDYKLMDF